MPSALRPHAYRTMTADETWERVSPLLDVFSITRVADVTGLDEIGLPVHVAYRPTGRTQAVSIGSGLTHAQARVSAVMESIELWHAEYPGLAVVAQAAARDLDLGYDVRSLHLALRSPLTSATVLDWVGGYGLLTGRPSLVPYGLVQLDYTGPRDWRDVLFLPSSSGLACGNTLAEAVLHALHEVVERDCTAARVLTPRSDQVHIDPATSTNSDTLAVLAATMATGCRVTVRDITNDLDVPCYSATIWSAETPILFDGVGCHTDPDLAVGRALTEAVQSRLAVISGARDDIEGDGYRGDFQPSEPPSLEHGMAAIRKPVSPGLGLEEVVRRCATRVLSRTGVEPIVVDLTRADISIPACKVIAPALRFSDDYLPDDRR
jgi:ribosomal protein S12 methylthiotransferase accessory factor